MILSQVSYYLIILSALYPLSPFINSILFFNISSYFLACCSEISSYSPPKVSSKPNKNTQEFTFLYSSIISSLFLLPLVTGSLFYLLVLDPLFSGKIWSSIRVIPTFYTAPGWSYILGACFLSFGGLYSIPTSLGYCCDQNESKL